MLPWLFNQFMDGIVRKIKTRISYVGVKMIKGDTNWKLNTVMFSLDTEKK